MNTRTLAIVWLLIASSHTRAADPPSSTDATPDGPRVLCVHVGGTIASAYLVRLDSDNGATLVTDESRSPTRVPLPDIVRIRTWRDSPGAPAEALVFTLAGQDRIVGHIVESDGDTVIVATETLGAVSIDMLDVARIDLSACGNRTTGVGHLFADGAPPSAQDRVLLCDGTALTGYVSDLQPSAIVVEVGGHDRPIELDRVQAIALAGSAAAPRLPSGLHAVVEFTDGSRLTTASLHGSGRGPIKLRYRNQELAAPVDRLSAVTIVGGRYVPLTHLTPSLAENVPLIRTRWPHRINQSVTEGPLRVAGETFVSGIGVHSRSRLVFDLAGDYEQFTTRLGIDETAGPLADVEMVILTDGTERFRQRITRSDGLHAPVRINVTGAHSLELRVEFGANGAIQDRIDWIEPALIRPDKNL